MKVEITGIPELEKALRELDNIQFDDIVQKQALQMRRRAREPGGTPVDTGKLRQSSSTTRDEMGYTVEYAFQSCGAYKTGQKRQKLSLRVA